MFIDSHRTVFTLCSWLDLQGVTIVLDFDSKKLPITLKLLIDTELQISQALPKKKNIWKFLKVII